MNKKRFVNTTFIILVITLVGLISYFTLVKRLSNTIQQTKRPLNNQSIKKIISTSVSETVNWKVFTSKTEGFSIKYPNNWAIENSSSGNCGHNKVNGSDCRDRYDFVSPDGIRVRYVLYKDDNNDRNSCGVQSSCPKQNILDLEELNIQKLGQVYLIKLDSYGFENYQNVALHQPLSKETTPTIGNNKHNNFSIDFSLPSKTGGRYSLFITTSFAGRTPSQLQNISIEQFYNLESVKQGLLILKSLNYF